MTHPPISVTIITLNEEDKIASAIQSVKWANEIIVIDSGSTDKTVEIALSLGARVMTHAWPGYGQQKNYAQERATHSWVLNMDADEVVSEKLAHEIKTRLAQVAAGELAAQGFSIPRKTFFLGHWIKHGGWYPNYLTRLARRESSRWTEPHVHESLHVEGTVIALEQPLYHYAFSSIQDQILTNLRFSKLGSQDLQSRGQKASIARLLLKPFGKFVETYFLKRGFLDGLPGLIISINAAHSMFLKYAYLIEADLKNENSHH